jgi:hypothetical protein
MGNPNPVLKPGDTVVLNQRDYRVIAIFRNGERLTLLQEIVPGMPSWADLDNDSLRYLLAPVRPR